MNFHEKNSFRANKLQNFSLKIFYFHSVFEIEKKSPCHVNGRGSKKDFY